MRRPLPPLYAAAFTGTGGLWQNRPRRGPVPTNKGYSSKARSDYSRLA